MQSLVLDCSVAISWCFSDEASEASESLLAGAAEHIFHVPSLWFLEVANCLAVGERRQRINMAEIKAFTDMIASLSLKLDEEASLRALHDILAIARAEKISAYDATYIELALRKHLPLATRDKALQAVAARLGIRVLI